MPPSLVLQLEYNCTSDNRAIVSKLGKWNSFFFQLGWGGGGGSEAKGR